MTNGTANINIEVIESEDHRHRYVLQKVWNKQKPMVTIITLYPGSADLVVSDMTQMLITNELYKKNFGGFYSVNLFSEIGFYKKGNKKLKDINNMVNNEIILECAKKSKQIIFAWGSLPKKNSLVNKRMEELVDKLSEVKVNCFMLTDDIGEECYHPLATKVRYGWNFVPFLNTSA